MIASERSLAASHQSQQHRQQSATLGKARNGAAKPPIRPVKIYVIDPRKLQQRLEAYVDQKNQKRAEAEAEKDRQNTETQEKSEEEDEESVEETQTVSPPPEPKPKTANGTHKPGPAKILPTLAPKLPPPPSTTTPAQHVTSIGLNTHDSAVLGNGVTLQSLPYINGGGLNIPALPFVVTNGVALIQPPISQSSNIPTSGLFLPGITAIPSVVSNDGTLIRSSQPPPHQLKANQRNSTTQKRKVKKKAKKRKAAVDKDKEDEEDGELSYLLKETTTRLGRISRPVSQPHSPLVTATLSATSSRAPSPNSKLKKKKKVARKEEAAFKCETCVQVFVSKEKLSSHFEEFPSHLHKENTAILQTLNQKLSTNKNVQDPVITLAPPMSSSFSHTGSIQVTAPSITFTNQRPAETTLVASHVNGNGAGGGHCFGDNFKLSDITDKVCKPGNFESVSGNARVPFTLASKLSQESSARNTLFSTAAINKNSEQQNVTGNSNHSACIASIDDDTGLNVSLVPTADGHSGLFRRCMSSSSNVVQVPSSYSIPSSPPSRCHSPGSPDNNIFVENSLIGKHGASSPSAVCNSPVDPMLLHSRSPFPPPIPETSSHSVSASNLSIPEESLCKGELFMDLGDGVLEHTSLSRISPTPFGNNDSGLCQLFADSGRNKVKESQGREGIHSVPVNNEQRDSPTGSSVVTPMLLETTTEDANDGEIFKTANYTRTFLHPSVISSANASTVDSLHEERNLSGRTYQNCTTELPRTPQSACLESDVSMDSSEATEPSIANQRSRSIWQFVKDQIKSRGISQACGEISEMADKLSRIARDHFIPIREEEIERLGNSSSIIQVDTPFFSHLLDLPFGMYIFKEDVGTRKKIPPPPPMTSSELSFTGGVEDVEKFLPPDIDLISLPHLTNLDLT